MRRDNTPFVFLESWTFIHLCGLRMCSADTVASSSKMLLIVGGGFPFVSSMAGLKVMTLAYIGRGGGNVSINQKLLQQASKLEMKDTVRRGHCEGTYSPSIRNLK